MKDYHITLIIVIAGIFLIVAISGFLTYITPRKTPEQVKADVYTQCVMNEYENHNDVGQCNLIK